MTAARRFTPGLILIPEDRDDVQFQKFLSCAGQQIPAQKHWMQFYEAKQGVLVLLYIQGSSESNTITKVVSKLWIVPLSESHQICVTVLWLLVCVLSVYWQTIGFRGRHMDKMRISYKREGEYFRRMISAAKDILTYFYWGMKVCDSNTHKCKFHFCVIVFFF